MLRSIGVQGHDEREVGFKEGVVGWVHGAVDRFIALAHAGVPLMIGVGRCGLPAEVVAPWSFCVCLALLRADGDEFAAGVGFVLHEVKESGARGDAGDRDGIDENEVLPPATFMGGAEDVFENEVAMEPDVWQGIDSVPGGLRPEASECLKSPGAWVVRGFAGFADNLLAIWSLEDCGFFPKSCFEESDPPGGLSGESQSLRFRVVFGR